MLRLSVLRLLNGVKASTNPLAVRSALQMKSSLPSFRKRTLKIAKSINLSIVSNNRRYSTSVKQEIWEEDELSLNKQKLSFRLLVRGKKIDLSSTRRWNIDNKTIKAPFFGQERALTELLHTFWHNQNPANIDKYNRAAFIIKEPEGGKSRFLSEWILQIFEKPSVIQSFLEHTDLEDEKKTNANLRKKEISMKKSFLNTLYYSAYRQYMVLVNGSDLKVPFERDFVADLYLDVILSRFKGMQTEYLNETFKVTTKQDLKKRINHRKRFEESMEALPMIFIQLCNQKYPEPPSLPFPRARLLKTPCIVFMIDDIHKIARVKEEVKHSYSPTPILREIFPLYEIWSSARTLKISNFIFSGATLYGDNIRDPCTYGVNSLSLDNLLDRRYLVQLCELYFKHQWPVQFDNHTSNAQLPVIDARIADILLRNFLRAFGSPVAIRDLIHIAHKPVLNAIQMIGELATSPDETKERQLSECLTALDQELAQKLLKRTEISNKEFDNENSQRFTMRTAILRPTFIEGRHYDDKTGHPEFIRHYVGSGQLSMFQFGNRDMTAVHFFYTWTNEQLQRPINCLKSGITETEYWKPYEVSHASLMLDPNTAKVLFGDPSKGVPMEEAIASAIYTRYCIRGGRSSYHTINLEDIAPYNFYQDKASSVNYSGFMIGHKLKLVKLKQSWQATKVLEEVVQHQVIAIDSNMHDGFTYVIIPIIVNFTKQSVMLIRITQDGAKSIEDLSKPEVSRSSIFFQFTISPFVHEQTKVSDTEVILPASVFISPLYLIGMSFFHRQDLIVPIAAHYLPYYQTKFEKKNSDFMLR